MGNTRLLTPQSPKGKGSLQTGGANTTATPAQQRGPTKATWERLQIRSSSKREVTHSFPPHTALMLSSYPLSFLHVS